MNKPKPKNFLIQKSAADETWLLIANDYKNREVFTAGFSTKKLASDAAKAMNKFSWLVAS